MGSVPSLAMEYPHTVVLVLRYGLRARPYPWRDSGSPRGSPDTCQRIETLDWFVIAPVSPPFGVPTGLPRAIREDPPGWLSLTPSAELGKAALFSAHLAVSPRDHATDSVRHSGLRMNRARTRAFISLCIAHKQSWS